MLNIRIRALALAGAIIIPNLARAQFADEVVSYSSGAGFAAGFTNASAALGAPASGSAVTPFAPPFAKTQLVSIGAGGEITLQFNTPILNDPASAFGVSFLLFANSFFVSSGGNVSGLFSHAVSAVVQVSQDDSTWYTLNPALAPEPGQLFPTSGAGNPQIPVNPALTLNDFTGENATGISALYAGSAGGTGYDLSWATNGSGNSVDLPDADYVRIEVQSGVLDLDAVAETASVPERMSTLWALALVCGGLFGFQRIEKAKQFMRVLTKSTAFLSIALTLLGCLAAASVNAETITENFTNNPAADGWQTFGDTNLFAWDSTNHDLIVTWDSSQPNSYFYHPLQTQLGEQDAFTLSFDLTLSSAAAGGENGFEVSLGFLNLADATSANFLRGTGFDSPNLVEFDFFPAYTFESNSLPPSIDATLVDEADNFVFVYNDTNGLDNGVTYHVEFNHDSGSAVVEVNIYTNDSDGQLGLYSTLPFSYIEPGFSDYFVDTIAISSYNDLNANGFINATGTVANISVTTTPRPVGNFITSQPVGSAWQVQFSTRANWFYTLQRSTDLKTWTPISPRTAGIGDILTMQDPNPPPTQAFYRILASQ